MKNTGNNSEAANLRKKAEKLMKKKPLKTGSVLSEAEMIKLIRELEVQQIEMELKNEELILAKSTAQDAAKKYTELFDFAPSGYFILSRECKIIKLNHFGLQMLGKKRSSLINTPFGFFISKSSKPIFNRFLRNVFNNKTLGSCEVTLSTNGNLPMYVHLSGIVTEDGEQCLITAVDFTESKRTKEKLLQATERLSLAQRVAGVGVWDWDMQTGKLNWSPELFSLFGLDPEQSSATFDVWRSLLIPNDRQITEDRINEAIRDRKQLLNDYQIVTPSGQVRWISAVGNTQYAGNGKPLRMMGVCFDITERKQMEEELKKLNEELEDRIIERTDELLKSNDALKQTEEKYRTVADFTYDWEYWINAHGDFIYVSPSCQRITGYASEEFMNDNDLIYKIIHPEDLNAFSNHITHQFHSKDACEIEFRIITKEGNERWIGHACQPVFGNKGEFLGKRGSNRDITEKVKAENELLNGTIEIEERERNRFSHELHDGLGPLLSTIKLYFQWLAETDDAEKIKIITEKGNNNIEKAIQTTREVAYGLSSLILNNYGYVDAVLSFTQSINDTQKLTIDFTYNSDDRFSNFHEIILYRITTELINNTLKYANATHVKIIFNHNKERNIITFTYTDDGSGFDLDGTEKPSKGLGLMNIQQRIKTVRGIMRIETSIGKGMKVYIELPVNEIIN